ncbi:hydrogen peroxide-dependent heme synthase [Rothia uropygialis]|uniref:hydrogen peroxide-dependent heme synthase n=1 Tax=Kocuria sp. 36 TaxID=1415402 RepID=UPI00101BA9AD|nr:hydrogen peroxide-dependent heme synthase [Kocuria sp. 36]
MAEQNSVTTQAAENRAASGDDRLYYALYTVFARGSQAAENAHTPEAASELESTVAALEAKGVTVRGMYDVSGMRNNADILVWTHADNPEDLQAAVRDLRRTVALEGTEIVWSTMGVHRDAEFTRNHAPAFARGKDPEAWVCVYPFVRSWDWYYMDEKHRAEMLKNHGMKGRDYPQVLANTIATFALNDYEWVLALEAPELVDLVDLMRHFRNTEARLHVREETPFYTGRRIGADEVVEVLR